MTISLPDTKQLWGRAASTCSICRHKLDGISSEGKAMVCGEAAHIIAENESGPRGQSILSTSERNSYFNLILLCPTCHTIIDKDPMGNPIEKLHILKAQHELRVHNELELLSITYTAPNEDPVESIDAIVKFVNCWDDFLTFYSEFYIMVQAELMDDSSCGVLNNKELMGEIKEWHKRKDQLKELLFKAVEEKLIIQVIPDWERLKLDNKYIKEGGYSTPFSYMLDFTNPVSMVNLHGDGLWIAMHISFEYCDYLSYKYPDVKKVWKKA